MSNFIENTSDRIAFVQPFGLANEGGGAKVLQSLLADSPIESLSVNTLIGEPKPTTLIREVHLSRRPSLGRLEQTRFHALINSSNRYFSNSFTNRVTDLFKRERISIVHAIAHSWDCLDAYRAAKKLKLIFALTVHDDLLYALKGQSGLTRANLLLADMWQNSDLRFVISEELGQEYCSRYGRRPFLIITDGLKTIATKPRTLKRSSLRVYFMGMLHNSYLPNFRLLISALEQIAKEHPDWQIALTARCGAGGNFKPSSQIQIRELPFVDKNPTVEDMKEADVTFLPLPFDKAEEALIRYSLSTKMVGYLGSGVPVLYHGPSHSAAGGLLAKHRAAQLVTQSDRESLKEGLYGLLNNYETIGHAGLELANSQFLLSGIRDRFWGAIGGLAKNR